MPSDDADDQSNTPPPDEQAVDAGQSIEDLLLEFDEQEGVIRDRSLLDPTVVVEEDRIVRSR